MNDNWSSFCRNWKGDGLLNKIFLSSRTCEIGSTIIDGIKVKPVRNDNSVPSEFLAFADAGIINKAPVIRGI